MKRTLSAARETAGLTQAIAASQLGIRRETLRRWENYESSPPGRFINEIGKLYRCSVNSISWEKPREYTVNQITEAAHILGMSVPELLDLLTGR